MSSFRNLRILCSGIPTRNAVRAGTSIGSRAYSVIRQNQCVSSRLGVNRKGNGLSLPVAAPSSSLSQNLHTSASLQDSFKVQDEEDFNNRVLKSKKPVVVQFHATWCGPCKLLSPRMEKSIAATKEAIDLAQVDIDDNPDIAMSYSVGAVPAVMAIKDGKVVDKFVGLKDEDQIDTFIAKLK